VSVLARLRLPLVPGAVSLQLVQNFKEEQTHGNSSCFGRVKGLRYVNFFPEAHLAAEAYIHHMCTAPNLIKTCCFEGAACDLVTSLGPERFTEWKAALINHAAGKVPNLFRLLEADVRDGRFQPHPEEGALKYRPCTPGHGITHYRASPHLLPRLAPITPCRGLRGTQSAGIPGIQSAVQKEARRMPSRLCLWESSCELRGPRNRKMCRGCGCALWLWLWLD
jgi:hypothetical protein